jgi:hypothetical protein
MIEDASGAGRPCTISVDYVEKSVRAWITAAPQYEYKAIWRESLGCTLIGGGVTEEEVRSQNTGNQTSLPPLSTSIPWPRGEGPTEAIPDDVDEECINRVMDEEFSNRWWNVRAYTIVYNGKLIYERYAQGITANMPLLGWSMTKSIASALSGLLYDRGHLQLDQPIAAPEWNETDEVKKQITYDVVLRMSSGIQWTESLHLIVCLYKFVDCAKWYAELPQRSPPDTEFFYSTGQTMLLSRAIHEIADNTDSINHFEWVRRRLFDLIDVRSGLIEHMAMGYVGAGIYIYLLFFF